MTAHGEAKAVREYVAYLVSDIIGECQEALLVRYAIEGRPAIGNWEDEPDGLGEKARLSLILELVGTTAWKRLGPVIIDHEDRRHEEWLARQKAESHSRR